MKMVPWVYRSFMCLESHLRRPSVHLAETHTKGFVKGLQVVSTFKSFIPPKYMSLSLSDMTILCI